MRKTDPVTRALPSWTSAPPTAAGLVVIGLACQEVGASIAVLLFPSVGAPGMVTLRLVFSALVLLLVARPKLGGRTRRDWMTAVLFGVAIAAMNSAFYLSIERIPLGIAVTIEVLGPLTLSVIAGRTPLAFLCAGLAVIGVIVLGGVDLGRLEPLGVALALVAAACWIGYILASAETGRRFARLDGLAIAMAIGAVLSLPGGIVSAGASLVDPVHLGLGFAVALLSSAIPYGLEMIALRRLSEATFGVLMSLAPGLAASAGLLLLGQAVHPLDLVGIGLVIAASIGAVVSTSRRRGDGEADDGRGPVGTSPFEAPVA